MGSVTKQAEDPEETSPASNDNNGSSAVDADEPSMWASDWSLIDPKGPLRMARWLMTYVALVSFVVPLGMLFLGLFVSHAWIWLMYWWPWTLFFIVFAWAVDNVIMWWRNREPALSWLEFK